MEDRLRDLLPDPATLTYHGRHEAASPATGSHKAHEHEEREIISHALDLPPAKPAPAIAKIAAQQPATASSATPVSD
jgi:hypothetical protein